MGDEEAVTTLITQHPADTVKMLRETFCVAQVAIGYHLAPDSRVDEHLARLQRLIDDCDRQRPLGLDGKHGDLHTDVCGCDDE